MIQSKTDEVHSGTAKSYQKEARGRFYRMGYNLIPMGLEKVPLPKWKLYQTHRIEIEEIKQWQKSFGTKMSGNWAVLTGHKPYSDIPALIIVDSDDEEAEAYTSQQCPVTPCMQRTPGGGGHRAYRRPSLEAHPYIPIRAKTIISGETLNLDLRADGGYFMCPGSISDSRGKSYTELVTWTPELIRACPVYDPSWIVCERHDNKKGKKSWSQGAAVTVADFDDEEFLLRYKGVNVPVEERMRQARRYMSCVPGTVQGTGADRACMALTFKILYGFAVPPVQCLELMSAWGESDEQVDSDGNHYAWSEAEITRKIEWAMSQEYKRLDGDEEQPGVVGDRLNAWHMPDVPLDDTFPDDHKTQVKSEIITSARQLPEMTDEALAALVKTNDPPTFFVRAKMPTRIRIDERTGKPFFEILHRNAMRGVLARCANWMSGNTNKEGKYKKTPVTVPYSVVDDLLALPSWPGLPPIDSVTETPVFIKSGKLISGRGYNRDGLLWMHTDIDWPSIPDVPTAESVASSVSLLGELLCDFPFKDQASKANALALVLLPYVRHIISGPTPLHLVNAPTAGTGKDLLAQMTCILATGRQCETRAESHGEQEWQKNLTSCLSEGPQFVYIENVNYALSSGTFSKCLTGTTHRDRTLGHNDIEIVLPINCTWIATGNNVMMSGELARRIVEIRIDANEENPSCRTGFKHELPTWAYSKRRELTVACLTIIQSWVAAGMPKVAPANVMGSFENYCSVLNGILRNASVGGFLDNRMDVLKTVNSTDHEWDQFVRHWFQDYQGHPVRSKELMDAAKYLPSIFSGSKAASAPLLVLGQALGRKKDTVHAGFKIVKATDEPCTKAARWRLEVMGGEGGVGGGLKDTPHSQQAPVGGSDPSFSSCTTQDGGGMGGYGGYSTMGDTFEKQNNGINPHSHIGAVEVTPHNPPYPPYPPLTAVHPEEVAKPQSLCMGVAKLEELPLESSSELGDDVGMNINDQAAFWEARGRENDETMRKWRESNAVSKERQRQQAVVVKYGDEVMPGYGPKEIAKKTSGGPICPPADPICPPADPGRLEGARNGA